MRATSPRSQIATLERTSPPKELLKFKFGEEDAAPAHKDARAKPRSIKEALVQWLDQQL